jgi:hypothetical protein
MAADLPELVRAAKVLSTSPTWVDRGPDAIGFTASLEIGEVVIEGLTLRGRCRTSLVDREVILQLEYHAPQIAGGPICRIEWRPLNSHNNKGLGSKEWQHRILNGTHHHRFDLNWAHSEAGCLRGDIPIAVPLDDPPNYRAFLAVVAEEFRIDGIQRVPVPPWQPTMI